MAFLTTEDCAASRAPGRLLRRMDKLMSGWIEARFPIGDVNFSQWIALKLVRDGIATSPGELARELGHTTGAVTRLVDGLEVRGLIARDRGHSDRRVIRLVITRAGEAKVMELSTEVVGAWNEVLADFDQREFDQLLAGLLKLLAAIERKTGDIAATELAA